MRIGKSWVAGVALALCAAFAQGAARADLLRCTGPDGRVIYTDDKSVCPDAKPYQPAAEVHDVAPTVAPAPEEAPEARRTRAEELEDAQAGERQRWRQLKADKEEELRQVVAAHASLKGYVSFCNRGNYLFTHDEAGIKTEVSCHELNQRLASLDTRAAGLRNYLDNELEEECRRAGCLPGWLR